LLLVEPSKNVKGRGIVKKDDERRSLLGWEEEDYLKVNKRLMDHGKRFKDNFYRNKRTESLYRVGFLITFRIRAMVIKIVKKYLI
jgi:hypothetical protein